MIAFQAGTEPRSTRCVFKGFRELPLRKRHHDLQRRFPALPCLDHVIPLAALRIGEQFWLAGKEIREEAHVIRMVRNNQKSSGRESLTRWPLDAVTSSPFAKRRRRSGQDGIRPRQHQRRDPCGGAYRPSRRAWGMSARRMVNMDASPERTSRSLPCLARLCPARTLAESNQSDSAARLRAAICVLVLLVAIFIVVSFRVQLALVLHPLPIGKHPGTIEDRVPPPVPAGIFLAQILVQSFEALTINSRACLLRG